MSEQISEPESQGLAPKQQTLFKSSMLMASGTLVSRILGFVRSALLIAALGVTAGVADSFSIANQLPNMVYNLVAAGIMDAILIPQIVRALKGRSGSTYVNKLLTAAGTLLFLLTILAMIAIPLIITVLAPTLPPGMRALTITFSIICVPQIFFYGLYSLFGELLNARGMFGPYMWAPVINNVVGIASLALFLYLWGPAGEIRSAESITTGQIVVLAGLSTVGVMAQALWLLIPLRNSGMKLRLDFKLKGTDFGSASRVAWWTFATLLVSQVGVISTSNLATRAGAWAQETEQVVAGIQTYQYAFMLYMVPQSLISVTLATAIFTRLANDVADGNMKGVANNYHRGVELIMLFSFFVAAVLVVTSAAVMQMIMPTFGSDAATIYGNVLIALIFALPSTGMVLMSQRVFFAMEDAKPVFLMGIVPTILQVIVGWTIYFTSSAEWWTVGASAAETVARVTQGFIAVFWVGRVVRQVNVGRLVTRYLRYLFAFALSALVGWGAMHLLGGIGDYPTAVTRFFDSAWKVTVVACIVGLVYFGLLSVIDPRSTKGLFEVLFARFGGRRAAPATLSPGVEVDSEEDLESALSSASKASEGEEEASKTDGRLGTPTKHHAVEASNWADSPPDWEQILAGQAAERTLARNLLVGDMSSTGAIPMVSGALPLLAVTEETTKKRHSVPAPEEQLVPSEPDQADLSEPDQADPSELDQADPSELDQADLSEPDPADEVAAVAPSQPVVSTPELVESSPSPRHAETASEAFEQSVYGRTDQGYQKSPTDSRGGEEMTYQSRPAASHGQEPPARGEHTQDDGKRFNPTVPALVLGVLLVLVAGAIAVRNLLPPGAGDLMAGFNPSEAQSEQQSQSEGQSAEAATPTPTPEAEAPVVPVISGAAVFSWDNDDGDHPELASALLDGDPSTIWRSRYFNVNEFSEGNEVAILLNLAEPAPVTQITINFLGQGGELIVRNVTDGNPRQGEILATVQPSPETVITLAKPTEVSALGLVFNQLPTDDEGTNRAKITGISIR